MHYVNIATATILTGWSERTLWRRFADGSVIRSDKNPQSGKVMVLLDSISSHFCISLNSPEDLALIQAADNGDAEAQTDIALIFHAQKKFEACVYWLQLAEKKDYPPAMRWLGTCYIKGEGIETNDNMGIMWLAKSAAFGDPISQVQIKGMKDRLRSQ